MKLTYKLIFLVALAIASNLSAATLLTNGDTKLVTVLPLIANDEADLIYNPVTEMSLWTRQTPPVGKLLHLR